MNSSFNTLVVNFIAGPGSGKTTACVSVFAALKKKGIVCEYVPEYAKHLVWRKEYHTLDNQYVVSQTQASILESMHGKVQVILTDGPLLHGLYYNRFNSNNTSNVDKTEAMILREHRKYNNLNVFIDRGDILYETHGRMQSFEESKMIDMCLKSLMQTNEISYITFSCHDIDGIVQEVLTHISKN